MFPIHDLGTNLGHFAFCYTVVFVSIQENTTFFLNQLVGSDDAVVCRVVLFGSGEGQEFFGPCGTHSRSVRVPFDLQIDAEPFVGVRGNGQHNAAAAKTVSPVAVCAGEWSCSAGYARCVRGLSVWSETMAMIVCGGATSERVSSIVVIARTTTR